MNFLFLHNNFPGQFHRLAVALAQAPDNRVVFASCFRRKDIQVPNVEWRQVLFDTEERQSPEGSHPSPLQQGMLFAKILRQLKDEGFYPDIIHGHVGFGVSLFSREIFPKAMQAGYFEWYYTEGADVAFFGGKEKIALERQFLQKHSNMCVLSALQETSRGFVPTAWQLAQFPLEYQHKLAVIHDGVDVDFFSPAESALKVEGLDLTGKEIITYATRGLEPYRGFHTFYRALPEVLEKRPLAHALIMADDRTIYGGNRSDGKTWREALEEEVPLDRSRVHFLPFQPYPQYRALLRSSHVHVYFTAPFVLSWSMLEAMSCGCLLVASDTEPVREVLRNGRNGFLTPFNDPGALAQRLIFCLGHQKELAHVRTGARNTILNKYNLSTLLPLQIRLLTTAWHDFQNGRSLEKMQHMLL